MAILHSILKLCGWQHWPPRIRAATVVSTSCLRRRLRLGTSNAVIIRLPSQTGPVRLAGPKKENKWRRHGAQNAVEEMPRYLSKFGYDIGDLDGSHLELACFSQGTGNFKFRFQLAAPKSIPEAAVIQLEVYLATRP